MMRLKRVKLTLALLAVLGMTSAGWAAKGGGGGPGIPGDLNPSRNSVVVSVPVPAYAECDALNLNETYVVKAYIFQPSGRIFAIGISEPTIFPCSSAAEQTVEVTIGAFPGLTFKPGPATLLFKVILTEDDGVLETPTVDTVIYEYGSRVDLH